jgi:hypothetical protein
LSQFVRYLFSYLFPYLFPYLVSYLLPANCRNTWYVCGTVGYIHAMPCHTIPEQVMT